MVCPRSVSQFAAVAANVVLGHAGFDEWVANAPLIRGLQSWAMIFEIVEIGAVNDCRQPELVRLLAANAIELVLAEKTPIDRILRVGRIVNLVRVEDDMAAAQAGGETFCRVEFSRRNRRRRGGEGNNAVAQRQMRRLQQKRRIDAG